MYRHAALDPLNPRHLPYLPLRYFSPREVVERIKIFATVCAVYNKGRLLYPPALAHATIDHYLAANEVLANEVLASPYGRRDFFFGDHAGVSFNRTLDLPPGFLQSISQDADVIPPIRQEDMIHSLQWIVARLSLQPVPSLNEFNIANSRSLESTWAYFVGNDYIRDYESLTAKERQLLDRYKKSNPPHLSRRLLSLHLAVTEGIYVDQLPKESFLKEVQDATVASRKDSPSMDGKDQRNGSKKHLEGWQFLWQMTDILLGLDDDDDDEHDSQEDCVDQRLIVHQRFSEDRRIQSALEQAGAPPILRSLTGTGCSVKRCRFANGGLSSPSSWRADPRSAGADAVVCPLHQEAISLMTAMGMPPGLIDVVLEEWPPAEVRLASLRRYRYVESPRHVARAKQIADGAFGLRLLLNPQLLWPCRLFLCWASDDGNSPRPPWIGSGGLPPLRGQKGQTPQGELRFRRETYTSEVANNIAFDLTLLG
jgi:hypothetical protein